METARLLTRRNLGRSVWTVDGVCEACLRTFVLMSSDGGVSVWLLIRSSRFSRDKDRLWLQPAAAIDTGQYICMLR